MVAGGGQLDLGTVGVRLLGFQQFKDGGANRQRAKVRTQGFFAFLLLFLFG